MKCSYRIMQFFLLLFIAGCSKSHNGAKLEISSNSSIIFTTSSIHDAYILADQGKLVLKIDKSDAEGLAKALFHNKGKEVTLTINGQLLSRQLVATSEDPIEALEIHAESDQRALLVLKEAGVNVQAMFTDPDNKALNKNNGSFDRFNKNP